MSIRTQLKIKEAFMQYSKKICTAVSIFWMAYRAFITLLIFFRPETATSLVRLTEGADTIMIVNISFYTGNSVSEKALVAFGKRKLYDDTDDDKNEEENETKNEETVENG